MIPLLEQLAATLPKEDTFAQDNIRRADWLYAQGLKEQCRIALYDIVVYGRLGAKTKLAVKQTIEKMKE